jgi:FkbM family methyltransferase
MPIYPPNSNPVLINVMRQEGIAIPALTMVDVGCSCGIDTTWAPHFDVVEAYGVDPLVSEIGRLRYTNTNPRHHYFDGYVTGPKPPPKDGPIQNWFDRVTALEAHRLLNIDYEKSKHNSGQEVQLSNRRFTIDEFCAEQNVPPVHFLKSDTDGFDYSVLAGARDTLRNVLGVHVEATFATEGGGAVFRDIDTLLNDAGFYLAGLHPAYYTRAALPGRFCHPAMADEDRGGTSQGEFLFLRDIIQQGPCERDSVLRLAIITELYNLADIAAEALVALNDPAMNPLLDALVRYSGIPEASSYADLMDRFRKDPRVFAPR